MSAQHIESGFSPLELDAAAPDRQSETLRHLAVCPRCSNEYWQNAAALAQVAEALTPGGSDAAEIFDRLYRRLDRGKRFTPFLESAAQVLDLKPARVRQLFAGIDDPGSWTAGPDSGVWLYQVRGGPQRRNALTAFIKLASGASFPRHRHLGLERTVVLQGVCDTDRGESFAAGAAWTMEPGSGHALSARVGADVILCTSADEGVDVAGSLLLPG